jgi:stearoyl-CoA desaturase (Delta-9 desaturase)
MTMNEALGSVVASPAPARGTVILDRRQVRLQRLAILSLTIGPFVGLVAAIASLWGRAVGALELVVLASTYVVTGLGITVGFHRLLTHRSFDTPRWLRLTFAIFGSMAIEGSVISWVADHRRHHAYADKDGDPHSPHLDEGEGVLGALKGLWHAHVGWLLSDERTDRDRWAPDLMKDPGMLAVDRAFPLLAAGSLLLPAALGFAFTGTMSGAVTTFLWGGLVRVFVLHHVTWSVNSICHFFGTRPFVTTDYSTNNWPLALISFGESWHNNHHAFPTSARHGLGKLQLDMGGALIGALERLRLAYNVKRPTPKQLTKKAA